MADWKRTDITHELSAVMVSQTNFAQTLGTISGVDWRSSSLEAAYYTDLRTGGKLRVKEGAWTRGAFIRIVHHVPEFGYTRTLGTYVVTDEAPQKVGGEWFTDLTLDSTLVMLADDLFTRPLPIDRGMWAVDAMKKVLIGSGAGAMRDAFGDFGSASRAARVAVDDSLADDVKATKAQVLEAGKSRLEAFFALANMSNNRIDVTPDGYIKVSRYTAPASKSPSFTFDMRDTRGTVLADTLTRSSDWLTMPDTFAVRHDYSVEVKTGEVYKTSGTRADGTKYKAGDPKTKTEQRSIYGQAVAKFGSQTQSVGSRGYSIVDFRQVNSISPHTQQAVDEYARKLLYSDVEQVEWELRTTYVPLWEGDVVNLVIRDGDAAYRGTRKCLVKNVDIDLGTMLMSLTLKETAGGDAE